MNICLWMWISLHIWESNFQNIHTLFWGSFSSRPVCWMKDLCVSALNLQECLLLICVALRWERWKSNEKMDINNKLPFICSFSWSHILTYSIQTEEVVHWPWQFCLFTHPRVASCCYFLSSCMHSIFFCTTVFFSKSYELFEEQIDISVIICS